MSSGKMAAILSRLQCVNYCLWLQPEDRASKHLETLLETGVDEMSWDDTVSSEDRFPLYSDVMMGAMASQITSASIVYSTVQAQIKENIKGPHHWLLWGEFTGDRWIPPQRASIAENVSIWWRHHTIEKPTVFQGKGTIDRKSFKVKGSSLLKDKTVMRPYA